MAALLTDVDFENPDEDGNRGWHALEWAIGIYAVIADSIQAIACAIAFSEGIFKVPVVHRLFFDFCLCDVSGYIVVPATIAQIVLTGLLGDKNYFLAAIGLTVAELFKVVLWQYSHTREDKFEFLAHHLPFELVHAFSAICLVALLVVDNADDRAYQGVDAAWAFAGLVSWMILRTAFASVRHSAFMDPDKDKLGGYVVRNRLVRLPKLALFTLALVALTLIITAVPTLIVAVGSVLYHWDSGVDFSVNVLAKIFIGGWAGLVVTLLVRRALAWYRVRREETKRHGIRGGHVQLKEEEA